MGIKPLKYKFSAEEETQCPMDFYRIDDLLIF